MQKPGQQKSPLFDEGRDYASFPPKKVMLNQNGKRKGAKAKEKVKIDKRKIEEGSSSLVISGDLAGHWWTCSIISPIVPDLGLVACMKTTEQEILKMFKYQPATGRCLTFLVFLGLLCETLAKEYEETLTTLASAIKLGVSSFPP
jgi:hypothetical protein